VDRLRTRARRFDPAYSVTFPQPGNAPVPSYQSFPRKRE
jgi:hypothetical protein